MATQRYRSLVLAVTMCSLLMGPPAVFATDLMHQDDPTFASMLVDGVITRPLGLCATVVGTALWIVTLPMTAVASSTKEAGEVLVVRPAKYTFTRPFGEL